MNNSTKNTLSRNQFVEKKEEPVWITALTIAAGVIFSLIFAIFIIIIAIVALSPLWLMFIPL